MTIATTNALGWTRRARPALSSLAVSPSPVTRDADAATRAAVAEAVRHGLRGRRMSLPPWLLYDAQGSALFEQITDLPEYYLTRTERGILDAHASSMIEAAGTPLSIVELGAGSAAKTQLLLRALLDRQTGAAYMPVDVSASALDLAQTELARFRRLTVRPVVARYPEELGFLNDLPGRRLVLFLGSNIGNYDAPAARALLSGVRRHLNAGDALLIGTDLRKSAELLLPAYDDAQGVTAAFNKNVLARINRDLDGDFALSGFRHLVKWNARASRVELYLESRVSQRVSLRAVDLELRFAAGQRIHTESSHKFTTAMLSDLFGQSGFSLETTWTDAKRWFAVHLARVASRRRPR